MPDYSLADAKNGLSALIDAARSGEHVVITRHGHPVIELRPLPGHAAAKPRTYDWLKARRNSRKPVAISSVELLRMLDEPEA